MGHSTPAVTRKYLDPRIVEPDTDTPQRLPKVS
jgi:hypothetical protein